MRSKFKRVGFNVSLSLSVYVCVWLSWRECLFYHLEAFAHFIIHTFSERFSLLSFKATCSVVECIENSLPKSHFFSIHTRNAESMRYDAIEIHLIYKFLLFILSDHSFSSFSLSLSLFSLKHKHMTYNLFAPVWLFPIRCFVEWLDCASQMWKCTHKI